MTRMPCMQSKKGCVQQRCMLLMFVAVFGLMTLFILNGFISVNIYATDPFLVATKSPAEVAYLKKWSGKDDYMPFNGNKRLDLRCRDCALVTSSSHVLGSRAGEDIDRTECVIRMNNAPTRGFETDVGKRTSLRVIAHSSVLKVVKRPNEFLQTPDNTVYIFWGHKSKIGKEAGTLYSTIQGACSNLTCFGVSDSKMDQFDVLFFSETGQDRKKSHSWLSTGWFTMVIAIERCDNIKVYGMVPPDHCGNAKPGSKKTPYHYYDPRGEDECIMYQHNQKSLRGSHHRFITEKQVYARWAKLYNITFVHPTWS